MSSPALKRSDLPRYDVDRYDGKPPAALTGSPGTSIFLPPPSRPSTNSSSSPPRPVKHDAAPLPWSFDGNYGLLGAGPASGVGTWFGRRRDRVHEIFDPSGHTTSVVPSSARGWATHSNPELPHLIPREPTVAPSPPRLRSYSPLPAIPASNAPSPQQSRAASPVVPPSTHLRRPATADSRPIAVGSRSAIPAVSPPRTATSRAPNLSRPGSSAGVGSAHSYPPPARPRRPATSSGIPSLQPPSPGETFIVGAYPIVYAGNLLSRGVVPPHPKPPRLLSSPPILNPAVARAAARKAARLRGFLIKDGKRHHPRPCEEAPYPRNYEHKVLDHDVWEQAFAKQLSGSTTFHIFSKPPSRVLDLGCGTGNWILECAHDWPDTYFTGLDLVPIQPDLTHLPSCTASRITWLLANFLEPLPFPDGAFSFVHVRRVARGVPEDKWGALFEEVARVLEPGGAVEVVEEDLFFPGSVWVGGESHAAPEGAQRQEPKQELKKGRDRARPKGHTGRPATRPRGVSEASTSASASETNDAGNDVDGDDDDDDDDSSDFSFHGDPRDHSILERAYTGMHAARFINLSPLSMLYGALVQYFRDVRSHPILQISFPPPASAAPSHTTSARSPLRTPSPTMPTHLPGGHISHPPPHRRFVTFDRDTITPAPLPFLNRAWQVDVGALHMHLSARVVEVLACAEEMWGWLCAEDGDAGARANALVGGGGGDVPGLGKEEWEECLGRFEMDMQDKIGLPATLTSRLAWRVRATPRTPERRAFDDAVRRWERRQARRRGVGAEEKSKEMRGMPLSRRLRVFVAWKAE